MAKLRLLDMHALPVRLVCYRSFTVGIKVSSILGRAAEVSAFIAMLVLVPIGYGRSERRDLALDLG